MIMSDDELDRIKKKQLDDLLKHQQEQRVVQETPVMDLILQILVILYRKISYCW